MASKDSLTKARPILETRNPKNKQTPSLKLPNNYINSADKANRRTTVESKQHKYFLND